VTDKVADIAEDDPPAPIRAPRRRAPAAKIKKAARKPIPNKIQNVLWGRSAEPDAMVEPSRKCS